jgi:hypothetical protein
LEKIETFLHLLVAYRFKYQLTTLKEMTEPVTEPVTVPDINDLYTSIDFAPVEDEIDKIHNILFTFENEWAIVAHGNKNIFNSGHYSICNPRMSLFQNNLMKILGVKLSEAIDLSIPFQTVNLDKKKMRELKALRKMVVGKSKWENKHGHILDPFCQVLMFDDCTEFYLRTYAWQNKAYPITKTNLVSIIDKLIELGTEYIQYVENKKASKK